MGRLKRRLQQVKIDRENENITKMRHALHTIRENVEQSTKGSLSEEKINIIAQASKVATPVKYSIKIANKKSFIEATESLVSFGTAAGAGVISNKLGVSAEVSVSIMVVVATGLKVLFRRLISKAKLRKAERSYNRLRRETDNKTEPGE